ncbi:hypothetical protein [Reyranella sp.]|uniref:hypothetical protein n=1 Tax=Reyranella sp. TaxID=1929291 RepID=UPI003BA8466C
MKPVLIAACSAVVLVSACTIREERTVQQPAPATVVAPAPSKVVNTDSAPSSTTTTVYTTR